MSIPPVMRGERERVVTGVWWVVDVEGALVWLCRVPRGSTAFPIAAVEKFLIHANPFALKQGHQVAIERREDQSGLFLRPLCQVCRLETGEQPLTPDVHSVRDGSTGAGL